MFLVFVNKSSKLLILCKKTSHIIEEMLLAYTDVFKTKERTCFEVF